MSLTESMQWTHEETIGLANVRCSHCQGTGLRPGIHRDGSSPCNCVLRNIFRTCLRRFQFCAETEPYRSKVVLMPCQGYDVNCTWTRTSEDYMADFFLVAKRALDESDFRLFRYHFLLGADWKLCCRQLKMDRGSFFHAVYRIEQRMGRVYKELRPYALHPVDEYFSTRIRKVKVPYLPAPDEEKNIVRPPVKQAA